MRCIVIDDEKPAVDLVCSYIAKVPFLELAGSFNDLGKAVTFIFVPLLSPKFWRGQLFCRDFEDGGQKS